MIDDLSFNPDDLKEALYSAFEDMGYPRDSKLRITEEVAVEAERRALAKLVLAREAEKQPHHCHWPGCTKEVPPKMWGCRVHWYMLPKYLRDKVWAHYVPDQEITKTPSPEYIKVAEQVQAWIRQNHPI